MDKQTQNTLAKIVAWVIVGCILVVVVAGTIGFVKWVLGL